VQVAPGLQTLPQVPQLKLSAILSTQAPLQTVGVAAGQPHTPEAQVPPMAHTVPHVPQLAASVARVAQPLLQVTRPIGQVHTPAAHTAPGLQALPQVPQLPVSVVLSTHTELQRSGEAAGHTHCPAMHEACTPQAWPHMPQLPLSVWTLVQLPLQVSGLAPPQGPQAPAKQPSPVMHAFAQRPQLAGSFCRSAHVPLQSVSAPHIPASPPPAPELLEAAAPPEPVLALAVMPPVPAPPEPELDAVLPPVLDVPPPVPLDALLPQPSVPWITMAAAAQLINKRKFIRTSSPGGAFAPHAWLRNHLTPIRGPA
jgi:hypothetical protein